MAERMGVRWTVAALSAAVAMACACSARAASGDFVGAPQRLYTQDAAVQVLPAVAVTPAGQHWLTYVEQDATTSVLHAQAWYPRLPLDAPQDVAVASSANVLNWPAVGASQYGYALIAWQETLPSGPPQALYARAYFLPDATQPSGPAFQVGTGVEPWYPAVAANDFGTRFAVAWVQKEADGRYGVHLQRYDSSTLPVGAEQRVDVNGLGIFQPIALAMSGGLRHAVAWCGNQAPGDIRNGIFVQRYDDTTPLGAPQLVAAWPSGSYVQRPALAMAGDGAYVVAWEQGYAIRLQRFDADGNALDAAQIVSDTGTGAGQRSNPSLAIDRNGAFVVAWDANDAGGSHVMARRYAADGTPRGAAFAVDEGNAGQQVLPRVAVDADGDALIGWTSTGADGQTYRAYVRRVQGDGDVDLALAGSAPMADYDLGDSVSFTFDASNRNGFPDQAHAGAGTATGVQVRVQPAADTAVLGAGGDGWQCAADAGAWQCRYAQLLPPGGTATPLQVQAQATNGAATLALHAHIAGDQADSVADDDSADVALSLHDLTPDALVFATHSGVARGSLQVSDAASVSGIDVPVQAYVIGGEMSVNGGAFSSAGASVEAGDSLRLRHTAASGFASAVVTTVYVGRGSASFTSITEAQDTTPDAFVFAPASGVATGSEITSAAVAPAGFNAPAPIGVSGGSYSVNGGAFTSAAGVLNPGDAVRLRHTSAASADTAVSTTLTLGGTSAIFTSTTGATDTTPDAFAFADVSGARRGRAVTSASVTVGGINHAVAVTVSGGGARWSKNGGAFTTAAGTVVNGDRVRLQVTASSMAYATVDVVANIGGVSDTWSVTSGSK